MINFYTIWYITIGFLLSRYAIHYMKKRDSLLPHEYWTIFFLWPIVVIIAIVDYIISLVRKIVD